MELTNDYSEWDLADALWSGGLQTYKRLSDYWSEIYSSLEEMFEGDSLTSVNDYLWHTDDDEILENAGVRVVHWENLEDLIDTKAIKNALKGFDEIDKKLEEMLEKDEELGEDGNGWETVEDVFESEYGNYEDYELGRSAVEGIESDVDRIIKNEERTGDTDSIISAIETLNSITSEFDDYFEDIASMASDIDDWLTDNDVW